MSSKFNFCTLFNINFLSRALCLYESLKLHCAGKFNLVVFCMDLETEQALLKLGYPEIQIIPFSTFVQGDLEVCFKNRNRRSFYWTCSSFGVNYCLKTIGMDHVTYVDADIFFLSNPEKLILDLGQNSVSMSPHNYSPAHDYSKDSGKYCVQFMTFKNTPEGLLVSEWWKNACFDWCHDYFEDGKFGDQKYLDDWLERFSGVKEIQDVGAGLAPWNFDRLKLFERNRKNILSDSLSGNEAELVFFHLHGLKFLKSHEIMLCDEQYHVPSTVKNVVYGPYLKLMSEIENMLRLKGISNFNYSVGFDKRSFLVNPLKKLDFKSLFRNVRFWLSDIVRESALDV